MSSALFEYNTLMAQVSKFLSSSFDNLNVNDLFKQNASTINKTLAAVPLNEQTVELLKKVAGYSATSAALAGSAFYFGYKYAKLQRHRFEHSSHNYQVINSNHEFNNFFLFFFYKLNI